MRTGNAKPSYVLDTSAILAFLEEERGADRVEHILRTHEVILPFVVLLETFYITMQERGEELAYRRYTTLKSIVTCRCDEVNEPILLTAGRFKANHRVSLADALIAAFAYTNDAVLVHKDPEYEPLASEVRLEALPYKGSR